VKPLAADRLLELTAPAEAQASLHRARPVRPELSLPAAAALWRGGCGSRGPRRGCSYGAGSHARGGDIFSWVDMCV
jgi:hypothetical protein